MNCQQLAARIEALQPGVQARDVARLCLLLANQVDDLEPLSDESMLQCLWREVGLRLQALTDQHAAMTEELTLLADAAPTQFSSEQVQTLLRALKVQSQVLQLYVGPAPS
jgi:hypothetical protein